MTVRIHTISSEESPDGDTEFLTARFQIADWTVNPPANRLNRGEDSVKLEPKVMDVLVYLAGRPGKVVSREELEASVWAGTIVSYDTVTGAIQKLRKALGDDPRQPGFIETLSKRGYRLMAPVRPLEGPDTITTPKDDITETARPGSRRTSAVLMAIAVLLMVITAGLLYWLKPWATQQQNYAAGSGPSSIAVLPFDNMSGDPEQEYFADGLTDDLITGLAKNPGLLVIARDSTFVYKDQALDVREVADRLNVRYVLNGSVRRSEDQVRINAQLVDAGNGSHLWAETYDVEMSGIFELQDEITGKIINALTARISTGNQQDLGPPLTDDAQAYDYFLMGRHHFYLFQNGEENRKARELFRKAIDADPKFAMAWAMLSWTHAFDVMNGWVEDRHASLQRALDLAQRAIAIQEALPVAYFVTALAHRERGEYIKALVAAEKAIEYDPNYANAHVLLATILYYTGSAQEGLERIRKAMQLNPHHPYNYTFHLGQAYYILGRYDEAAEVFEMGIASNPSTERLHVWLAAAYAQQGNIDDAEWEAEQVLILNPYFSWESMQQTFPFNQTNDRERFLEGLRKAGLSG